MDRDRRFPWLAVLACAWLALPAAGCGSDEGGDDAVQADVPAEAAPEVPAEDADAAATDEGTDAADLPAPDDAAAPEDGTPPADTAPVEVAEPEPDVPPPQDASEVADPGEDTAPADVPDAADPGFDPGPVVPIEVNSGATGEFSLSDGQWKVFSFPAEAGQVYSISPLAPILHGYVGSTPSVSPASFDLQTPASGMLAFVAGATATQYVAVGVTGGGASGFFQVSDGGRLLSTGTTAIDLPASTKDEYYVFHFPIAGGTSYRLQVTGPSTVQFGISAAPRSERGPNREFLFSNWTMAAYLPADESLPAAQVDASYSGYYYFAIKDYYNASVPGPRQVSVTISAQ